MKPTRLQLVLRFALGLAAGLVLAQAHQVHGLAVGALLVILGAQPGPLREAGPLPLEEPKYSYTGPQLIQIDHEGRQFLDQNGAMYMRFGRVQDENFTIDAQNTVNYIVPPERS